MFTEWDKAIAAAIVSVLSMITLWWGWDLNWLTDQRLLTGLAIASPLIVWAVPNKYSDRIQRLLDNIRPSST